MFSCVDTAVYCMRVGPYSIEQDFKSCLTVFLFDWYCSGNTTYLFMALQLYTAFHFHGFRHASLYNSCKETISKRESRDPTNTIAGYPYKSSLSGFLHSLPVRV